MRLILLVCCICLFQCGFSQPQLLFSKVVKSDSTSAFTKIVDASDGNVFVSGYMDTDKGYTNAYFAKMTEKGVVLWEKMIDKKQDSRVSAFVITKEMIFWVIVHAHTIVGKKLEFTSYLQKWDSVGNVIGEFQMREEMYLSGPMTLLDNGDLLVGVGDRVKVNDSINKTMFGMAKFGGNGNMLWSKTFEMRDTGKVFYESTFQVLGNGEIVFVASNGLEPNKINWDKYKEMTMDISLIYCKENGEEMSRKEIVSAAEITQISPTSDGNFMVLGSLYDKNEKDTDMYIAKVSAEKGESIWETNVHFYKSDHAFSFFETRDNHYVISGTCSGGWSHNTNHTSMLEIDNEGKVVWTKIMREGHFVVDGFQKADAKYVCAGLFSERYKQKEEETHSYDLIKEQYDAMLITLSENAFIWEKNLPIRGQEQVYCLKKDATGGYFAAGIDFAGNWIFLLKLDEKGEVQWRQDLGSWSAAMEVPVCIAGKEDGGCIAMNNKDEMFSFSKNGIMEWKSRDFHFKSIAGIIAVDEKSFFVAGSAWKDYPDKTLFVAKVNEKGKAIWQKDYDLELPIEVWDVAKTQDGGFVITGESGEIGTTKFALIKIDEHGKLLWDKSYALETHANAKALLALNDGGFVIAGTVYSSETKTRAYVMKTDAKGDIIWSKPLVKSDNDVGAVAMTVDKEGNIIVAANHEYSNYKGDQEIYVTKISPVGKVLWEKAIGGGNSHYVGGVSMSDDNQIIIAGYSNYVTHGNESDVYIVKVKNE